MQSNRSTKLCTATVDYSFYVRGTPNPGCDFLASTSPKNKEERYDIIIFNEYDESNTRASHIDMGIQLTATSCPAPSSIRPSASLESLQTCFFRTYWRDRKWFLNFLLGEPKSSVWAFKSPCDKLICQVESSMFVPGTNHWVRLGPQRLPLQISPRGPSRCPKQPHQDQGPPEVATQATFSPRPPERRNANEIN